MTCPIIPMHQCLMGLAAHAFLCSLADFPIYSQSFHHATGVNGRAKQTVDFPLLSSSFFHCLAVYIWQKVPLLAVNSSPSSFLTADGFVVGAVLFCHLILRGRASENDLAAEWREESEANTCLKVFGQTLPLGSLLCLPLLKGHPSMTAVCRED